MRENRDNENVVAAFAPHLWNQCFWLMIIYFKIRNMSFIPIYKVLS